MLFAIIIAGSRDYRHQADVYSWINVLLNRGFKRENIYALSEDTLGDEIYHTCDGPNIYLEDAILEKPSKEKFIQLMEEIPKGKYSCLVIYVNHGAYNMVSTPNGIIYVDEFAEAIKRLASKITQVTILIEACYSGSFAKRSIYPRNVFIMTASSAKEPSYAYSWCPRLMQYTSDEFTYHILNYLDDPRNNAKTIQELVKIVKNLTTLSQVISVGAFPNIQVFGKGCSKSVLGNTTISDIRRIKNTLDPEYRYKIRRIRSWLLKNIGDDYGRSLQPKSKQTFSMMSYPEAFRVCYKNVTRAYFGHDNLEAVHEIGLLCLSYSIEHILQALEHNL